MTFEEAEAESVRRYAHEIGEQMRQRDVPKLIVAKFVVSLIEAASGFCGDELGDEFVRRMLRARRFGRGFCPTCGKEKIVHPPLLCAACSDRDLT